MVVVQEVVQQAWAVQVVLEVLLPVIPAVMVPRLPAVEGAVHHHPIADVGLAVSLVLSMPTLDPADPAVHWGSPDCRVVTLVFPEVSHWAPYAVWAPGVRRDILSMEADAVVSLVVVSRVAVQ